MIRRACPHAAPDHTHPNHPSKAPTASNQSKCTRVRQITTPATIIAAAGTARIAATPPIVVNWAGSETVSAEDYCTYMGELMGVEPVFEYTPDAHTPLWPDVTHMHEVLGRTKIGWREGFRRMIEARQLANAS